MAMATKGEEEPFSADPQKRPSPIAQPNFLSVQNISFYLKKKKSSLSFFSM